MGDGGKRKTGSSFHPVLLAREKCNGANVRQGIFRAESRSCGSTAGLLEPKKMRAREDNVALGSEAGLSLKQVEGTREGLQVGDEGQTKGLRCDLVAKAWDASGRRGNRCRFSATQAVSLVF